jgi:hypothetical protein
LHISLAFKAGEISSPYFYSLQVFELTNDVKQRVIPQNKKILSVEIHPENIPGKKDKIKSNEHKFDHTHPTSTKITFK